MVFIPAGGLNIIRFNYPLSNSHVPYLNACSPKRIGELVVHSFTVIENHYDIWDVSVKMQVSIVFADLDSQAASRLPVWSTVFTRRNTETTTILGMSLPNGSVVCGHVIAPS